VRGKQQHKKGKTMNNKTLDDDLEPEYDLTKLRVRRVGAGRATKSKYGVILDSDVAQDFPSSEAVNEALRTISRLVKQTQIEITHK
jgi:hypothetical protein